MSKSVDEYLNEVDYSFKGYIPSKEALMFINFIKEVNDGSEENESPIIHLKMLDNIFSSKKRHAFLVHRGAAKTTLLCEYMILFIACFGYIPNFGKVNFILYVSDSIENGVKTLRKNIQYRYENSKFLKKLIPNKRLSLGTDDGGWVDEKEYDNNLGGRKFTDIRLEFENVKGDRLVVRGFGAKTGVRGTRELGSRPQIALIDDIVSDEDARSDLVINNLEDVVYKAVSKALHPKRQKIIWLGTPFNAKDPLYKAVESGAWNVNVFPVCEKFPCSKEEFKGSWEDRFNYEYVKDEYEEALKVGKPDNFYQELMLRVMNIDDRLVKDENIIWFDENLVLKNKNDYNFYITTDLSTTANASSDYSVITIWAINNNKDYMVIDGWCDKVDVSSFIERLFTLVFIYNPLSVGIEVTGQQNGFISWIREKMIERNIFFNLASGNNNGNEGIRPIKDKFSRFLLFSPKFIQKKIWIANKLKESSWGNEFLDEISKVSKSGFKSKHDDVLDTFSMLDMFEIYSPSQRQLVSDDENPFIQERNIRITNTIF